MLFYAIAGPKALLRTRVACEDDDAVNVSIS